MDEEAAAGGGITKRDSELGRGGGETPSVSVPAFTHKQGFVDACQNVTVSNFTAGFRARLDYVYVSSDMFSVVRSLEVPPLKLLEAHTA